MNFDLDGPINFRVMVFMASIMFSCQKGTIYKSSGALTCYVYFFGEFSTIFVKQKFLNKILWNKMVNDLPELHDSQE